MLKSLDVAVEDVRACHLTIRFLPSYLLFADFRRLCAGGFPNCIPSPDVAGDAFWAGVPASGAHGCSRECVAVGRQPPFPACPPPDPLRRVSPASSRTSPPCPHASRPDHVSRSELRVRDLPRGASGVDPVRLRGVPHPLVLKRGALRLPQATPERSRHERSAAHAASGRLLQLSGTSLLSRPGTKREQAQDRDDCPGAVGAPPTARPCAYSSRCLPPSPSLTACPAALLPRRRLCSSRGGWLS